MTRKHKQPIAKKRGRNGRGVKDDYKAFMQQYHNQIYTLQPETPVLEQHLRDKLKAHKSSEFVRNMLTAIIMGQLWNEGKNNGKQNYTNAVQVAEKWLQEQKTHKNRPAAAA